MSSDNRPFAEKYPSSLWGLEVLSDQIAKINAVYEDRAKNEIPDKAKEYGLNPYFRDGRSPEKYFFDMLDGWAPEDITLLWVRKWLKVWMEQLDRGLTIDVRPFGRDKDRILQVTNDHDINTTPDYLVHFYENDKLMRNQFIEYQYSSGVRSHYDMKEKKVLGALKDGTKFLWVVLPIAQFFICDPVVDLAGIDPTDHPIWTGKRTYSMPADRAKLHPLKAGLGKESAILLCGT